MEDWKNWNKRSWKSIIKINKDTKPKTKGIKRRSGGYNRFFPSKFPRNVLFFLFFQFIPHFSVFRKTLKKIFSFSVFKTLKLKQINHCFICFSFSKKFHWIFQSFSHAPFIQVFCLFFSVYFFLSIFSVNS